MSTPPLSDAQLQEAVEAVREHGTQVAAAKALNLDRSTLQHRLRLAERRQMHGGFISEALPSPDASLEEILERRRKENRRGIKAADARKLVKVSVTADGPIGILHMGDPHVDDMGCDIDAIERDIALVQKTDGLFMANVGDLQNNWVGRLARLHAEQTTTAKEAWTLVEWLVRSAPPLYLIGGNHDCWSGAGDPLQWITRSQLGVYEPHGARIALTFPNGKQVRVNARHDFHGHSMWNTAHGPMKAAQMGWRDHILSCGHKHTSGYGLLKDPASGLVSHAIRVAGYKRRDRYANEMGLPDQNISPAVVTVIDPTKPDDSPGVVTVFWDTEEGADFLKFKRRKRG